MVLVPPYVLMGFLGQPGEERQGAVHGERRR